MTTEETTSPEETFEPKQAVGFAVVGTLAVLGVVSGAMKLNDRRKARKAAKEETPSPVVNIT